jgi:DNA repair protein RecN (Recombination protein N)
MLATLKVRDLVLIDDIALDFATGLNVLTGETGAGKSILLDALGLATGARAGARSSVRAGASQGSAVAIFDLPQEHPARAFVVANGIACDGDIILRRTIAADARTRAFLNDEPIGVALLRELGDQLVEIHGRADERGLFDPSSHRKLLDAYGGHEELVHQVAGLFAELERLRARSEALKRAADAHAAEAEYLGHTVKELAELAPTQGEEAELASRRALLANAGRVAEDVASTLDLVAGDRGAQSILASALKRLARLSAEARIRTAAAESGLEQAFALVEDAGRELDDLLSQLEADPSELERTEERLSALRAMARKHGVKPDDLPRTLAQFRGKLENVQNNELQLAGIDVQVACALAEYRQAGEKLSAARKIAAERLETAVAAELVPLRLGHARFRTAFESVDNGESAGGIERVWFEVATIAGQPFGPLAKIASGGELARFSLALKVALAGTDPPAALIFDEVDRGVGGAVAYAVGERLQRVARSTQILLVTHSPQVAARAARHFRITRRADKTKVELLGEDERVEEIARMLAGAAVTDEARAAARRLLVDSAERTKARRRA